MKLYGKQKIKQSVDKRADLAQSDKDAIIWSVNLAQHYAYVKIQGSDTQIKAHYPGNWDYLPRWLKPGNAVRLRHKQGKRGYIEIIGPGRAIPSPVTGDNFPTATTPSDAVLTGMNVRETSPNPSMAVAVESGTYRINGVTYSFSAPVTYAIPMRNPADMIMTATSSHVMGAGDHRVIIGNAPATGYCRYDIIIIGTDEVVNVIEGVPALLSSGPTMPDTQANHVRLAWVFLYAGLTVVRNHDIDYTWVAPYPVELESDCPEGGCILRWNPTDNYPERNPTWTIKDQYDQINNDVDGALVNIVMYGTGTFKGSADAAYRNSGDTGYSYVLAGQLTVTYKRDQTLTVENEPVFIVTLDDYPYLKSIITISLEFATSTTTTSTTSTTSTTTTVSFDEDLVGYYTMNDAQIAGSTLTDLSSSSNDGTLVGSPTTGEGGSVEESVLFVPPTPQYVNLGDVVELEFSSGDFSFACWVYCTETLDGTDNANYEMFSCETYQSDGWKIYVGNTPANHGKVVIRTNQSGTSTTVSTVSQVVFSNTWTHIVFTKEGTTPRIFINKNSVSVTPPTISSPAAGTTVKHIAGTSERFAGNLDDMRFYSRALKQYNINQIYTKSLTTTTTTTTT